MIFTGDKPRNPPDTISLSKDFFDGEKIAVDVEVKALYQEDESSIIGQYIIRMSCLRLWQRILRISL